MTRQRLALLVRSLLLLFTVTSLAELVLNSRAEARVGGGRSFGQRPMSAPRYQSQPRAPQPQQQPMNNSMPQAPSPNRGSFMRGLAGGVAGGVLGSMLFSSLGRSQGSAAYSEGGGMSGGGGGIGIIELLLLGGAAFLAFRWWKNRQMKPALVGGSYNNFERTSLAEQSGNRDGYFGQPSAFASNTYPGQAIENELAQDIFFKIQGAWTRRDLSSVRDLLGSDIAQTLDHDLNQLKQNHKINRLENISIRKVDIGDSWREGNMDLVQVRFTANLLDYTVHESSGEVLEGSTSTPVKFEEDWIFSKSGANSNWQLSGIQQA